MWIVVFPIQKFISLFTKFSNQCIFFLLWVYIHSFIYSILLYSKIYSIFMYRPTTIGYIYFGHPATGRFYCGQVSMKYVKKSKHRRNCNKCLYMSSLSKIYDFYTCFNISPWNWKGNKENLMLLICSYRKHMQLHVASSYKAQVDNRSKIK